MKNWFEDRNILIAGAVKEIQEGRDIKGNYEKLWEFCRPAAEKCIRKMGFLKSNSNYGDLLNSAFFGLVEAAGKHNDIKGPFYPYAAICMKYRIYNCAVANYHKITIPHRIRYRLRDYCIDRDRGLDRKETQARMGLSDLQLKNLERYYASYYVTSLQKAVCSDKKKKIELIEFINDGRYSYQIVEQSEYLKDLHEILSKALNELDFTTKNIIVCHYYLGMTKAEIGQMYGVSDKTVGQRIFDGFTKIRTGPYGDELIQFL